ncbi:RNA polymerase sigma factor [Breznakia pachnodae]|uniref:RNA polymerase sigma factor (Sigma-70 family) n=1 Tax=Breznakia pachnodae TaxID=265178 RepID=A0ABU0E0G0_9FIRM|nr:RNA polymerase sigma factor [Breznakia pachnodae]MDQ0360355.1 RNA polymerase sigma factor (sigma-70 family) [Breznakia pachnodae]
MSGQVRRRKIDVDYIKAFKAGDQEAFNYIYNYYKNSLYYFIFSYTKDSQDAEEVFQDTFVRIHNRIQDLEKLESFESWAFSIAHSMTMSFLKRNKKKKYFQLEEDIDVEDDFNIVDDYEKGEVVDTLKKGFEELNPIFKSVAQLRYLEELSVNEIADTLSVPVGTVKRRLSRIREIMQPILEKQGITPDKYFSLGGVPILYQVIKESVAEHQLSATASQSTLTAVAGGSATTTSSMIGGGLLLKVITAGVLMVGTGVFYQSVTQGSEEVPTGVVDSVSYDKEQTNKDVEVVLELKEDITTDKAEITLDGEELPFELQGKELKFVAMSNGNYNLIVDEYTGTLEIRNIDKSPPVLNEIINTEQGFHLDVNDEGFGIDYKASYIEYQGKKYDIQENGDITGEFKGEAILQLFDEVGNSSTYQITIGD